VYIAAVKPSRLLLTFAALASALHAADEQRVTVKSNLIQNGALMVIADLQGKPTELDCEIRLPSCSQPPPGEYSMRPATADEGIYNDCTNVVLLKSAGAAKEKIGVYCWDNGIDCYMVRCVKVEIETIPAVVPDAILEPRAVPQDSSTLLEQKCEQPPALTIFDRLSGERIVDGTAFKDGQPLQFANVHLYSTRRVVLKAKTDSQGHFLLRGVPTGSYRLAFKGMGKFKVDVVPPRTQQGFFYRFDSIHGCLSWGFNTN